MAQNDGMVKGLLVGLLAGGAIGAVLALLYAPKSGKEFRADLKVKADDLMGEAEEYIKAAQNKASDIVSEAKKRSNQLLSEAQSKANTLLEDADKVISGVRQKTTNLVDEGTRIKGAVKAGVDAYKEERNKS